MSLPSRVPQVFKEKLADVERMDQRETRAGLDDQEVKVYQEPQWVAVHLYMQYTHAGIVVNDQEPQSVSVHFHSGIVVRALTCKDIGIGLISSRVLFQFFWQEGLWVWSRLIKWILDNCSSFSRNLISPERQWLRDVATPPHMLWSRICEDVTLHTKMAATIMGIRLPALV